MGCCTWYNEPSLQEKIEERIQQPLKIMDPDDFSIENLLPSPLTKEELEELARRRGLAGGKSSGSNNSKKAGGNSGKQDKTSRRKEATQAAQVGIVYGQKANEESSVQTKKVTSELSGSVRELAGLEKSIQKQFTTKLSLGLDGLRRKTEGGLFEGISGIIPSSEQFVGARAKLLGAFYQGIAGDRSVKGPGRSSGSKDSNSGRGSRSRSPKSSKGKAADAGGDSWDAIPTGTNEIEMGEPKSDYSAGEKRSSSVVLKPNPARVSGGAGGASSSAAGGGTASSGGENVGDDGEPKPKKQATSWGASKPKRKARW
jgi:hypothetical protein